MGRHLTIFLSEHPTREKVSYSAVGSSADAGPVAEGALNPGNRYPAQRQVMVHTERRARRSRTHRQAATRPLREVNGIGGTGSRPVRS